MGSFTVAWRNLTREKGRLAISIGGVAFAVTLILVLRGVYTGLIEQATEYIRSVEADLWVIDENATGDFFHAVSLMPESRRGDVAGVAGVARVSALIGRPVVFDHGGRSADSYLLGVDPETGVGGPPAIERGVPVAGPGQLVVDRVFARNHGVSIGDALALHDETFEVVGVARGGNTVLSQFAWASAEDVADTVGLSGIVNYYLVEVAAGVAPEAVADEIVAAVPGVRVMTSEAFADLNMEDLAEGFLPIVWVLVVIALVIGTAVIGLTIYTATLERREEYGVLKAIGFSRRQLLGVVFQQSLAATAGGLLAGIVLTLALGVAMERFMPAFVLAIRAVDLGFVVIAAVIMSVLAAFAPARPVARLDPAQVFRA